MPMEEFKFPDEDVQKVAQSAEPEVEYEIVDDTPEEDRGRTPSAPPKEFAEDELDKYDASVKQRIKHFTKGYHDERRAKEAALKEREEAIRIAQQVVEENKKLKGSLNTNQQALLEQAKRTVAEELNKVKAKYKEAYEAGDSDALVAAQEEMIAVKQKVDRVNNFKPTPVQETKIDVQTPTQEPTQPPPDPKAAEWQRKNQWFGTDDEMTSFALGLHTKLVKSGVDPQSDDYYEKLNSRLKQVFPDAFESGKQVDAHTPSKRSNVAPATRSTATRKIVLTPSQVNIAKRLGVPLDLYARKVAEEMRK